VIAVYAPHGTAGLIGYGNNVWHANTYNNRLQPVQRMDMINNDPNQTLLDQIFDRGTTGI